MKFFIVCLFLGVSGAFAKASIGYGHGYRKRAADEKGIPRCPPPTIDVSASTKANETAQAWKEYCHCMKKELESEEDKGDNSNEGQKIAAAREKCKDPYEIVTEEYGHSYTIDPERGITDFEENGVVTLTYKSQYKKDKNDDSQYATYSTKVDKTHPITLEGTVMLHKSIIYETQEPLSICDNYDEGYNYLLVQLFLAAFTENSKCPQDMATFHISQQLSSMTIMSQKKMACGNYTVEINAENALGEYVGRSEFCFSIEKGDDCKNIKH